MLITTANDLPGYEITGTLGEVFGLTVGSRTVGSQIGAGVKAIVGDELKGMTKALVDSRLQVIERMVEEAQGKGADAIVAMRFDTSEMGGNGTATCSYCAAGRGRGAWVPSETTAGRRWTGWRRPSSARASYRRWRRSSPATC